MKTETKQQPLPTSPKGRSFLRSKAPSESGWCAGYSLPFGKGWGWASILCIMLLSPLFWRGGGGEVFAQANGTGAGNCLSYNGTSNYVSIQSFSTTGFTGISIECWVKTTATEIIAVVQPLPCGVIYINRFTTGKILAVFDGSSLNNSSADESTTSVNDGQWHHVVGTNNGTTTSIFVDGRLEKSFSETISVGTGTLNIGTNWQSANYFNGQIDEVRIWNTARTETEIRNNMCKKLIGNESGLVGYWRFDEGSGGTVYDASGNGNNGTLY